jgi:PAS domain S-box-containing protein
MPMGPEVDARQLRTALRDLVALSAVPAVWVGREPPAIAAGLADVLVNSLHLGFAFVRLCDPTGGAAVEIARGSAWQAFPEWLQHHLAINGHLVRREIVRDIGSGAQGSRGIVIPIGVNGEGGLVAAACDRTDFPTEIDQLLLSVAANHATTAFRTARLIDAHRRAEETIRENEQQLRTARDELEKKVAERTSELQRSEAYLAEAQRLSHTGSFGWDVSSGQLYWSEETFRIFECDLRNQPTVELVLQRTHPQDRVRLQQTIDRAAQERTSLDFEHRLLMPDGSVKYVKVIGHTSKEDAVETLVFVGAITDITERKRGEQRVAAQYAVTRILAEADSLAAIAPDMLRAIGENLEWDWGALWSLGQEGALFRCDCLWHARDIETAEFDTVSREHTFRFREGRIGQVWRSASASWIVDATTEPGFLRAAAASRAGLHGGVIFPILLDTEALGVVEFFSRAARERDEEQLATLSAIGSQIGQYIKRQRAEAGLRASEERWRKLFETSAAGMALAGLDGIFTAANPALQRMLGRTEEEIVGRNALELNPEEERAATAEALARYRSGLLDERHVEKKYLKKDGSPVWLNITTTVVPATETAAPFLQAVYVDITERVRFEAALRASEERWRAMVETAPVGIITFGSEHRRYVTANKGFQLMTGYTEDELRNLTPLDITHEDDRERLRNHVDGIVAGAQRRYRIEKRYRRKDGETVWADISTFVVRATDNTPAFLGAVAVDITDRKRAEGALQQAQADLARLNRVLLLGEMTASIAHEVNQPIAAVITNANAGLRWLGAPQPNPDEVRQALDRIVRDGTRAGEVIGRIRALVKKVPPRRDLLEINEAIREVVALTQTEMQRYDVRLQSWLADDLPLVSADRIQLQQVMINLIVNAIEAMAGVGDRQRELTIVSGIGASNDLFVEVQDTGPGVHPEKLDRLFQSFYTTKPDGIGMGLAISRSIVEAHGGRLSAAPNQPHGAVFRLMLPVQETLSGSLERSRC